MKKRIAGPLFVFFTLLFFCSHASAAGIFEIKHDGASGTQTASGVVSVVEPGFNFFMAEDSGPYRGIYVSQGAYGPDIGDYVEVTGSVATVAGRRQLQNITAWTTHSIGNTVFAPVELTIAGLIADLDAYEGSLVRLANPPNKLVVTNQNAGANTWQVNDGTGTAAINTTLDYNYFPRNNDEFDSITGIVKKTGTTSFQIQPRFTNDLRAAPDIIPSYALRGTVVTMDDARQILSDHYIWVRGDSIKSVTDTPPSGVEVVDVDGLIFPGLINTHDHPTGWGLFDFIPFPDVYRERNDWARDKFGGTMYRDFQAQRGGFSAVYNEIVKLVEVRMASSGCTVLQGAGTSGPQKLGSGIIHGERFPGRVRTKVIGATDNPVEWEEAHLDGVRGKLHRYIPHVAEGTDAGPTQSDQWSLWKTFDSFDGRDTIIHGINIPPEDFELFDHGTDVFGRPLQTVLSWAAKSNMLLYDATADIPAALAAGAIVCLAPDWTPSGMPNMLAELNFARSVALDKGWNIQTQTFIEMVTRNAAIGFGQLWRYGTIEPGKMANFMVIDDGPGDPYDNLMMVAGGGEDPDYRGGPRDVRLTIVAGRPIYGDEDLLNNTNFPFLFPGRIEDLVICGANKKLKIARWNPGFLTPINTEPFRDMYIDLWERYLRGNQYPSDFLPVDPCGVPPPTPVPTPPPPEGTYLITSFSDDAHQHISSYANNTASIWLGRRAVAAGWDAGFRFENIQLSPGEHIQEARLVLTQYTNYNSNNSVVRIAAHNVDDSPTFSSANGPMDRSLTSAAVDWIIPSAAVNSEINTPDFSSAVQEVIDRPGWQEGNAISIIIASNEPSKDNQRRVWAYDGDPDRAARLVIQTGPAPTPPCVPPPGFPEGFDGYDTGARPDGWTFTGIEDADVYTEPGYYGVSAPSLMIAPGAEVVSREFSGPLSLFFWLRGTSAPTSSYLLVDEFYGGEWHNVDTVFAPDVYGGSIEGPLPLYPETTRVRFSYSEGTLALDDVLVCAAAFTPTPPPTPEPGPTPEPSDTLVLYPFTGNSFAPTELAAGMNASDFAVSEGSLLFGTWHSDDWAALGSGVPYARSQDGWDAASWAEGKYFYIDVSPSGDERIMVEEIGFLYRLPPDSGPGRITIAVEDQEIYTIDPVEYAAVVPFNIGNLALSVDEETRFKIIGWASEFDTGEFRIDDVRLGGRVQVGPTPEPTPPAPTPEPTPPAPTPEPTPPAPTPEPTPADDYTLVNYPFTGESFSPTDLAPGVNATDFAVSRDPIAFGFANEADWNETGVSGVPYAYSADYWDAAVWTEGKHYYFKVSPEPPNSLLVNEIGFFYRLPDWLSAPQKITVAYDDTEIDTIDVTSYYTVNPYSIDNLGLVFTEEAIFKVVGWGAEWDTGGAELRIDDIRLGGRVLLAITPTPTATPTPTPVGFKTPSPPPTATATPTPLTFWPTPSPAPSPPYVAWYLPAGGTRIEGRGFDTYVLVYNPNPFQVDYDVSLHDAAGEIDFFSQTIAPMGRRTIKINDYVGSGEPAVSTMVSSPGEGRLMVERAMYWSPGGVVWGGGHGTVGIDSASREWFLTEGATHLFDMFIHVFNPSASAAEVSVELFNQSGDSWSESASVAPGANWTIKANDLADDQTQLSVLVTSDLPIAVDRTMYWEKGDWRDGHSSRGISRLSSKWDFAEGATHVFDYYIVVMNPSSVDSSDTLFTFFPDGTGPVTYRAEIPPRHRYTVNVGKLVGSRMHVGARVESLNGLPLAAERAMYWQMAGRRWEGGHGTIGAASTSLIWFLPEGATHRFDQYVLVSNPDPERPAQVRFRFFTDGGGLYVRDYTIPPLSRHTVNVGRVVGKTPAVATQVQSLNDVGIIAERAMYWPSGPAANWISGHSTIGVPTLITAPTPNPRP